MDQHYENIGNHSPMICDMVIPYVLFLQKIRDPIRVILINLQV